MANPPSKETLMARHPERGSSIGCRHFVAAGAVARVLPAWAVPAAARPAPQEFSIRTGQPTAPRDGEGAWRASAALVQG
jgi:hypothetical protein